MHQHQKENYLDNASTTKVDTHIAAHIAQVLTETYGNPSSLHTLGLEAELLIAQATREIKSAISAQTGTIYFTSGGTEANNLAIFGAAYAQKRRGNKIITTQMEHASVLEAVDALSAQGFDCVRIAPKPDGNILIEDILDACDAQTILVSVMMINNELGTITDLARLVAGVRKKSPNALIHTDAVQALGKTPLKVSALGIDLLTISGHKIYAPKGIGALYAAHGIRIKPLLYGGAQQGKIRPGTENTAYISALGMAATQANRELAQNMQHAKLLHTRLLETVCAIPNVVLNSPENASPFVINLSMLGLRSETILHFLAERKIFLSTGSACAKGATSPVLGAMQLPSDRIDSALRISLSKHNSLDDIDNLVAALAAANLQLIRKKI